ncbi:jg20084 [Pararge aegeria aegeria]|uniref:Jg20084 protein n=1 Tax=Pararge aegeria aegeria TaxID=348720 RepID=A0A8S4SBQ8_9NEOP|nr:jg20084 [Pararge aegeria aegeria]
MDVGVPRCWNGSPVLVSAALVDPQRGGQTTLSASQSSTSREAKVAEHIARRTDGRPRFWNGDLVPVNAALVDQLDEVDGCHQQRRKEPQDRLWNSIEKNSSGGHWLVRNKLQVDVSMSLLAQIYISPWIYLLAGVRFGRDSLTSLIDKRGTTPE